MNHQPGLFAVGTRDHYHLEFDLRTDVDRAALATALAGVHEARGLGSVNLVVGFGAGAWARFGDEQPDGLRPFDPIEGADGHGVPATQHDVWVFAHGTGRDTVLHAARAIVAAMAPVATVAVDRPSFMYLDSRDLTGFIDGTANPGLDEAPEVALIPEGSPCAGGTFVIAMTWVHDLASFDALPVAEQERVFGRSKPDSVEMDDATKPANAHIARVEIDDDDGEELEIFRRSTPWGTASEHGLYFVAFSADLRRYDLMLTRMFGLGDDGVRDRLTDFSTPVTASYYFAPSADALEALIGST